jgi:hypothetical protein
MEPNATMQLRDIKPLVEIEDSSFYLYWGLILLGLLAVIIIGYFLYQKFKIIQKVHREKEYLEVLNTIDWSSPKKAAYKATHYGRLLVTDERREVLFSQLLPLLERYKYKKETQRVDDETIGQFELYRRICNESV